VSAAWPPVIRGTDSEADFRAAHATDEFRGVVTAPGWESFPSSPVLFEVVSAVG